MVAELDDLGVAYDECHIGHAPETIKSHLLDRRTDVLPAVSINDDLLTRPTSANVMSAIMHARSAGFYQ